MYTPNMTLTDGELKKMKMWFYFSIGNIHVGLHPFYLSFHISCLILLLSTHVNINWQNLTSVYLTIILCGSNSRVSANLPWQNSMLFPKRFHDANLFFLFIVFTFSFQGRLLKLFFISPKNWSHSLFTPNPSPTQGWSTGYPSPPLPSPRSLKGTVLKYGGWE